MTHIEEAVITCKYALSLGLEGLNQHIDMWLDESIPYENADELKYANALREVKSKLGTEQCLLK